MKDIKTLLHERAVGTSVTAKGWVRTKRATKNAMFIELNDGSCFANIQCVFDNNATDAAMKAALDRASTGAALAIGGTLVDSPPRGSRWRYRPIP